VDPAEISAANDSKYVDVYNTGHVALNVLPNDSFDNGPATTGNVDIYLDDDDGSGNLHLNESTGDVSVDSGTSPGTYWLEYYICAQAEENCSDGAANDGKPAKVTITVGDPLVVASNDSGSVASGELAEWLLPTSSPRQLRRRSGQPHRSHSQRDRRRLPADVERQHGIGLGGSADSLW